MENSCRWGLRGGAGVVVGVIFCALVFASPARAAISFGQIDTFQDGTPMGWAEGAASPNPPANVATGGPRGEGDAYLQNVSSGGFSAGGKMVMFNGNQWAGDYVAAGVTRIDASLANFGTTPLFMRVALLSGTAVYGSASAVELPPDGVWRSVSFDLTATSLARVEGVEDLGQALTHVQNLRLLSAEAAPATMGDAIPATLGADDIRALRLHGDANFDGRVDSTDYVTARLNLGAAGTQTWRDGDFDFDGRVTSRDLLTLRRSLGQSIAAPAAARAAALVVPEPGSVSLLLIAGWGILRRRSRHASSPARPPTKLTTASSPPSPAP